eukprot:CAMPEP_0179374498 /NCGR_PEP_ID=MMETSP0797-20121207/87330_1 /TAXON_ID=47934 /ORGANISM="Dinophysis acuminata, Strain DAEP01" /LENGTH=212 /DNA_ID=CAMNT_0021090499 /DNA_START=8 /DNA_END=643 /DNA_ORIENTATION=-
MTAALDAERSARETAERVADQVEYEERSAVTRNAKKAAEDAKKAAEAAQQRALAMQAEQEAKTTDAEAAKERFEKAEKVFADALHRQMDKQVNNETATRLAMTANVTAALEAERRAKESAEKVAEALEDEKRARETAEKVANQERLAREVWEGATKEAEEKLAFMKAAWEVEQTVMNETDKIDVEEGAAEENGEQAEAEEKPGKALSRRQKR